MKATVTTEIELSIDILAQAFASLADDEQAQFFCKVAEIADRTYTGGLSKYSDSNADWQWRRIGKHLAECECSTERGRSMVRTIFEALEKP